MFEDELFLVVDCLICRTPITVLKAHHKQFDDAEKVIIRKTLTEIAAANPEVEIPEFLAHLHYGKPDWVIDWEQRRIPDHAHCHLRPFPFPKTTMWERIFGGTEMRDESNCKP